MGTGGDLGNFSCSNCVQTCGLIFVRVLSRIGFFGLNEGVIL